jgi:hypothetical protein
LQIKTKIVSSHTDDSKPVKQEVNSTVILPPFGIPCFKPYLHWRSFSTITPAAETCDSHYGLLGLCKRFYLYHVSLSQVLSCTSIDQHCLCIRVLARRTLIVSFKNSKYSINPNKIRNQILMHYQQ